jgi:hypothetical protein
MRASAGKRNLVVASQGSGIVQPMSCVTREVLLEDMDAEEAWDAVLDMEAWLAEEADVELEPGAEGRFRLDDGSERRALVEQVEPGHSVSWWWWSDDARDLGTHVEVRLVEAVAGTRVVVVESGFAVGPVASALGRVPVFA